MSKSELWTVSELAGEFDLTTQALRFYEEKGLLSPRRVRQHAGLRPPRPGTPDPRTQVPAARLHARGHPRILSLYRSGRPNVDQYRDGLAKIRRRLAELQAMKRDLEEAVTELLAMEQDARERIAKLEGDEPKPRR